MFLTLDVVGQATWLVIGLLWCATMLRRGPSDLESWRLGAGPERAAIVAVWLLTAGVALSTARFLWVLVARFAGA